MKYLSRDPGVKQWYNLSYEIPHLSESGQIFEFDDGPTFHFGVTEWEKMFGKELKPGEIREVNFTIKLGKSFKPGEEE